MSLLCRLAGARPPAQLTCLVSSSWRLGVVYSRPASQKKTLEKYAAKASKASKNPEARKKGDFLSTAGQQDDKKKSKNVEPDAELTDELYEDSKPREEVVSFEDELTDLLDDSMNDEFDYDNFTLTRQRYTEYERLADENKEYEEVNKEQLERERQATIKRLWEPYETESFNLKKLLGKDISFQEQKPHMYTGRASKLLYYTEEELNKYLPEGIAGRFKEYESGFEKKAVLVRPPAEDIISWLDGWRQKQFIGRTADKDFYTLLNGPLGCGKSSLLNPIVHWARMTGWLVLYVPDGKDWAGYPKAKEGVTKMLSYSKVNDAWFGQPNLATKWIKALLQAHADKLSTLPLRTNFTVQDVDPDKSKFISSRDKTIKDLLEYGLTYPDQASDCVWFMRQELCGVTEYPILIVVDAVNAFHNRSFYGDPIDPYVFSQNMEGSRLVLARAFHEFRNHGLVNGLYVGSIAYNIPRKSLSVKKPNYNLKRTSYMIDPSLAVTKVSPLSRAEMYSIADWYKQNGYLEDATTQTVDYLWAMSEGNGAEFWRQAASM